MTTVDREAASELEQERLGRFRVSTRCGRTRWCLRSSPSGFFSNGGHAASSIPTDFFSIRSISQILLKQMSVTGVLAVGMLFVIVTRQIDLSVGSLLGLAGGIAAMTQGWGLAPSPLSAIVIAVIVGALQGVPLPVIVLLAVAIAGNFLTQSTTFGRYLYAIGSNPEASRLSGINSRRHILLAFALLGALVGIASLLHTGRVGSASPDAGTLMELDAIAACVIGGTSLMGGRGKVSGALLSALVMASLDNGMSLLSVENATQYIIKGAVLVAAVGFDMAGRRKT